MICSPQPGDQWTVDGVITAYLDFTSRRVASSTLDSRHYYLRRFADQFRGVPYNQCRPLDLLRWLDSQPGWRSDWTKNSAARYVRTAFNWAVDIAEIIDRNPFKRAQHAPGLARRNARDEEFQTMLRAAQGRKSRKRPSPGARYRQILVFLHRSGCRPGEASRLEWTHIDWQRKIALLPKHKTARTQRVPRPRIIHLDSVCIKLLKWIRNHDPHSRYVFVNWRRVPWTRTSLSHRMQRARNKSDLSPEVKHYGLRHAFGTRAITNGCDLKSLAELMGHTSVKTTEHYLHLADQDEHLQKVLDKVNGRRTP